MSLEYRTFHREIICTLFCLSFCAIPFYLKRKTSERVSLTIVTVKLYNEIYNAIVFLFVFTFEKLLWDKQMIVLGLSNMCFVMGFCCFSFNLFCLQFLEVPIGERQRVVGVSANNNKMCIIFAYIVWIFYGKF